MCSDIPFILTLGRRNWECVIPEAQVHSNQLSRYPCTLCPSLTFFLKCLHPQGRRGATVMHNPHFPLHLTGLGSSQVAPDCNPFSFHHLWISGTLPSSPWVCVAPKKHCLHVKSPGKEKALEGLQLLAKHLKYDRCLVNVAEQPSACMNGEAQRRGQLTRGQRHRLPWDHIVQGPFNTYCVLPYPLLNIGSLCSCVYMFLHLQRHFFHISVK